MFVGLLTNLDMPLNHTFSIVVRRRSFVAQFSRQYFFRTNYSILQFFFPIVILHGVSYYCGVSDCLHRCNTTPSHSRRFVWSSCPSERSLSPFLTVPRFCSFLCSRMEFNTDGQCLVCHHTGAGWVFSRGGSNIVHFLTVSYLCVLDFLLDLGRHLVTVKSTHSLTLFRPYM